MKVVGKGKIVKYSATTIEKKLKTFPGRSKGFRYSFSLIVYEYTAEYDGNNNLLRKYIYGPGIEQPISMIEVADSNAAYYYH